MTKITLDDAADYNTAYYEYERALGRYRALFSQGIHCPAEALSMALDDMIKTKKAFEGTKLFQLRRRAGRMTNRTMYRLAAIISEAFRRRQT